MNDTIHDDNGNRQSQNGGKRKPTQAELLVKQVEEQVDQQALELFHTPDQIAYATFQVGSHRETYPLRSKAFGLHLLHRFVQVYGVPPGRQALQEVTDQFEAHALVNGPERPVHVRFAEHSGNIYLDLGDPAWSVVEITAKGWWATDTPPVRFRRPRGMGVLPRPAKGGKLDDLRSFLNIADDDWPLVAAWLVATFRPGRPFPMLNLLGPQGSGKSTDARVLRRLVDPNKVELRRSPRDSRDLAIAANNAHLIVLDNLSYISGWLSDDLCAVATGGGLATRQLYSDGEEALFDFIRPIMVTGINDLAVNGDLLDRSILVYLPAITEEDRQDEEGFWSEFERARPQLLGVVLDAVTTALERLPKVKLDRLPRMADFTKWAVAAAPSLGVGEDDFLKLYERNREQAHTVALEASPVGDAVERFMKGERRWEGSATSLLRELELMTPEQTVRGKAWPKAPHVLSGKLRLLQPNLAAVGIRVEIARTNTGSRIILERVGKKASRPSPASHTHADQGKRSDASGDAAARGDAPDDPGDAAGDAPRRRASRPRTGSDQGKRSSDDARDAGDAPMPTASKRRVPKRRRTT